MPTKRKFTDEQEREILKEYNSEEKPSIHALAKKYDCSAPTIQNAIKRQGGKLRKPSETRIIFRIEQEQEILKEYNSKERPLLHALAKKYDCSVRAIQNAIKRRGGRLRSKSECRKTFSVEQEKQIAKEYEDNPKATTFNLAEKYGCSQGLIQRIVREYGKQRSLGSTPVIEKSQDLNNSLVELIQSIGVHLENLPQKSWLAILRQSKALKEIGPYSKLVPVKIALLKGEITPDDILPPPPATDAPADTPAPKSKLQLALDAITATADDDDYAEPDNDQPETEDSDPINIIEEPEERKQRLANIRPSERLSVATAAGKVTDDEKVLRGICHAQCEALWTQVFAADGNNPADAIQLVAEVQQAKPTDKWSHLVRDTFLEDWRLVQECGQISGLLMPDGWRLNLMQRREAALLLRDRARLNISGMGAGKTLSAVAGMQVLGSKRVLVLCPNATIQSAWLASLNTHLPSASTASRTWQPNFLASPEPHWVINNHEMLSDLKSTELAAFLWFFEPDSVIIDEAHLCKARNEATESQRHRNLQSVADWCRNHDAAIYGMSGTPVVNELSEPLSLLRLIRPDLTDGLNSKLTGDNCMAIHEALQPISSRFVPPSAAAIKKQTIEVRADHLLEDALKASKSNGIAVDAALAPAKFNTVIDLAKKDGKLLVFTSSVAGVVDELKAALAAARIQALEHTGTEKGGNNNEHVRRFINDPAIKVLIASTSTLATGFDGLQHVCNRIAFLTLPWTAAEHEQAIARINRQGIKFETVELNTISAILTDPITGEDWSLDQQKLERLESKRSISAAVCDGVIPDENALRGGITAVRKAHRTWAKNVQERLSKAS